MNVLSLCVYNVYEGIRTGPTIMDEFLFRHTPRLPSSGYEHFCYNKH